MKTSVYVSCMAILFVLLLVFGVASYDLSYENVKTKVIVNSMFIFWILVGIFIFVNGAYWLSYKPKQEFAIREQVTVKGHNGIYTVQSFDTFLWLEPRYKLTTDHCSIVYEAKQSELTKHENKITKR